MKTITHAHSSQNNHSSLWHNFASAIEHRLMQKNRGRTALTRKIRCHAKLLAMRIVEMTYSQN